MSNEIVDDDENGFSADEFEPVIDTSVPAIKEQSDARRRIEELMERRRLKALLDDPYRDEFEEDL
ncbi:MAG: hypothetical protein P8103_19625 [Candidatus Thiodiazotropha sp.]